MEKPDTSKRVSVRLSAKDWHDLCHFVNGDLDNMDEACPIKQQMRRILETIGNAVARSSQP